MGRLLFEPLQNFESRTPYVERAASRAHGAAHRSGHQRGRQQSLVLQRCHVRRLMPEGIRVVQCCRATERRSRPRRSSRSRHWSTSFMQRWRLRVLRLRSRVGIYAYKYVRIPIVGFSRVLCVLVGAPSRARPVRDLYSNCTQLITRSSCACHMLTFTSPSTTSSKCLLWASLRSLLSIC